MDESRSAAEAGTGLSTVRPSRLVDAPINLRDLLIDIARSDPEKDHTGQWHPSSFGKCDRAMIFEFAGVKQNRITDETALYFWIGKVIHEAVQKGMALILPGIIWEEVEIESAKWNVHGTADQVRMVPLPDDSYEVMFEVYEYKSVRTNAFNFKTMPYDHHKMQVAMYLTFPAKCPAGAGHALSEVACDVCKGAGVLPLPRRGRIAYIGKEDGQIETYTITNSPELREEVYAKLRSLELQLKKYIEDGTVPEPLSKLPMVVKGKAQFYKRANAKKGIKVGDPKLEDDPRSFNCPYKGQGTCCVDKEPK